MVHTEKFPLLYRLGLICTVLLVTFGCQDKSESNVNVAPKEHNAVASNSDEWFPTVPGSIWVYGTPLPASKGEGGFSAIRVYLLCNSNTLQLAVELLLRGQIETLSALSEFLYVASDDIEDNAVLVYLGRHILDVANKTSLDECLLPYEEPAIKFMHVKIDRDANRIWFDPLDNRILNELSTEASHRPLEIGGEVPIFRLFSQSKPLQIMPVDKKMVVGQTVFNDLALLQHDNGRALILSKGIGVVALLLDLNLPTAQELYFENGNFLDIYRNSLFPEKACDMRLIYSRFPGKPQAAEFINNRWLRKDANGKLIVVGGR